MDAHDTTEVYIFLGLQHRTHFYIHTIHSEQFDPAITYQLYNVLIQEKQIVCPRDNVVVYELCMRSNNCNIIIITHATNPSNPRISKENLAEFFPVLVGAPRDDLSVIKYDYSKKAYLSYYVKNFDPSHYMDMRTTPICIDTMRRVTTSKPFPSS